MWEQPQPQKPSGVRCERCTRKSTRSWPVKGRGYFLYTCPQHHEWGEKLAGALSKKGGM